MLPDVPRYNPGHYRIESAKSGRTVRVETGRKARSFLNREARHWNGSQLDFRQLALRDPLGARACIYLVAYSALNDERPTTYELGSAEQIVHRLDSVADSSEAVRRSFEQVVQRHHLTGQVPEGGQHFEVYSLRAFGGLRQSLGMQCLVPYVTFDVPPSNEAVK